MLSELHWLLPCWILEMIGMELNVYRIKHVFNQSMRLQRRKTKHLQRTSSTPFDLKAHNSAVVQNGKISTRHNGLL